MRKPEHWTGIAEAPGGGHCGGRGCPAEDERADGAADVGGGPDVEGVQLSAEDAQGQRHRN